MNLRRPRILDRHADHVLAVRCITCTHTLDLPATYVHDRLLADPVSDQIATASLLMDDVIPNPGETIGQARTRTLREQRAEAVRRAASPESVRAHAAAARAALAARKGATS